MSIEINGTFESRSDNERSLNEFNETKFNYVVNENLYNVKISESLNSVKWQINLARIFSDFANFTRNTKKPSKNNNLFGFDRFLRNFGRFERQSRKFWAQKNLSDT